MKQPTYLLAFSLCMSFLMMASGMKAFGQPHRNCATMEHFEQLQREDPSVLYRMQDIEDLTRFRAKSHQRIGRTLITIPVVVHVVYNTEAQNISYEQIQSQIDVLNEDFGRFNEDANQTPAAFRKVAADTRIRFQLATRDPQGQPTNGITRTYTEKYEFSSFQNGMKQASTGGLAPWPTADYLNIWVCNLSMGVLGYSQFPGGPAATDGVVISYKYFGRVGDLKPPFNRGRTATHEVGHWLNLRHIWGDGPCGSDDRVADTPEAEGPTHGCLRERVSCGTPDMVSNFMDYTDDACMNLFTQGQAQRMRALFVNGGPRESLLYSPGLDQAAPPVVMVDHTPPPAPYVLEATRITHQAARLSWDPIQEADHYVVRLKSLDQDRWYERDFSRNNVNVSDLNSCTNYEFQVAAVNAQGLSSDFSLSAIFKTYGCSSEAPTQLVASSMLPNEALLQWQAVPGAQGYKVQYRKAGTRTIHSLETDEHRLRLTELEPVTWYQFRVRAVLPGYITPYSRVQNFYTQSSALARMARTPQQPDYMNAWEEPARAVLNVTFDLLDDNFVNITLLDEQERPVLEAMEVHLPRGEVYPMDVRRLRPGTYVLRVEDDQGFQHVKDVQIGW